LIRLRHRLRHATHRQHHHHHHHHHQRHASRSRVSGTVPVFAGGWSAIGFDSTPPIHQFIRCVCCLCCLWRGWRFNRFHGRVSAGWNGSNGSLYHDHGRIMDTRTVEQ
jgi:hypothetical protein